MTVEQHLTVVDATIQNKFSDDVKINWIREVDGRVLSELHRVPTDEIKLPESSDDKLALPDSYSRIYLLYIAAMNQFFSGKYTGYSHGLREYESALSMYAKSLIRNRQ